MHRVGRTARLGKAGRAYLFLLPAEMPFAQQLESEGCRLQRLDAAAVLQALPPAQPAGQVSAPQAFLCPCVCATQPC